MAARRLDSEEYTAATAVAREVRGVVAEQLAELVRSGDRMGSHTELHDRIAHVNFVLRRISEASGRHAQAREMGLPLAPAVRDLHEFRELLRDAVMQVGVSSATWVASMDYENARVEQDGTRETPVA